jgi:hypothetical protein
MIDEQLIDAPEQQVAEKRDRKMRVNVEDRSLLDDLGNGGAEFRVWFAWRKDGGMWDEFATRHGRRRWLRPQTCRRVANPSHFAYPKSKWQIVTEAMTATLSATRPAAMAWRVWRTATLPK